ncbi:MAG: tripartite tricarboxylate transporter permease [Planctomycetota bacterium]|nr:tripartite tricarboxylate transporter permease [Planctomycetota bacterium]
MEDLFSSLGHLFSPVPLCLMLLGTFLGITAGAIPGLTGAMLISLTLPLTFGMDGADAMVLLVSMYVGSVSGGLVTATLLNIPGTPASIMTTLDGYPLARSGQAGRALGLGISASFAGSMVSWCVLVVLARPVAELSTKLGPFEFFSLVLIALVLIASVAGRSLLRGLLAGCLGVVASLPGVSPSSGELRWTLGFPELSGGLKLLPVLIGVFAVSQVIRDIVRIDETVQPLDVSRRGMFLARRDWREQAANLLRSSFIGTAVGILPGIGANIGSILAYSTARNRSRHPERFGKGSEEGIVAAEAANSATVGGALVPLVALGIPGSLIDAILLGALVVHGLQPGPLLFEQHADVVYTIMATLFLSSCCMLGLLAVAIRPIAWLLSVPRAFLVPAILVFCVVGSYALSSRMFDVWVMLAFGLVGSSMRRARIPLAPFVIGFVLAPVAEENLAAGLMQSDGSYWPLLTRPVSLLFLLVSLALLVRPLHRRWRGNRTEEEKACDS